MNAAEARMCQQENIKRREDQRKQKNPRRGTKDSQTDR